MKKILITGANSYIGTSFENYIKKFNGNDYKVDTVDMADDLWHKKSFAEYDVVFHVAGIVHQKETKNNMESYFTVNRDLTFETAKKSKQEGVKQFIFLSSMSVYGKQTGIITKNTKPTPKTNYGKSKLQAEEKLSKLNCDTFKICILRPPMVYGEGCKGNYNSIIKIVKKLSVFPKVKNKRSMININNLCAFIQLSIKENLNGIFFPQDSNYSNTTQMAQDIAKKINKKLHTSYILGFFIILLKPFNSTIRKAFGSLIYKDTEDFNFSYCKKKQPYPSSCRDKH